MKYHRGNGKKSKGDMISYSLKYHSNYNAETVHKKKRTRLCSKTKYKNLLSFYNLKTYDVMRWRHFTTQTL